MGVGVSVFSLVFTDIRRGSDCVITPVEIDGLGGKTQDTDASEGECSGRC